MAGSRRRDQSKPARSPIAIRVGLAGAGLVVVASVALGASAHAGSETADRSSSSPGFRGETGTGTVAGSGGTGTPVEPGSTRVFPREVRFDAKKATALTYAFQGGAPTDIRIRVLAASTGRTVRSWLARDREPATRYTRTWNATDDRGRAVPSGRYRFRFGPAGTSARWPAGSLVLRDHAYPIDGPHSARGPIGEFGVSRSGGRTHEGFDELADCGTPLLAARGGRVLKAGFDPVLFGWFVKIDGRKTKNDYFYSHLRDKPRVATGERVRTAERIGKVGQTGNARSTPCHLHFELRGPDGPIDPEPALTRWDRWS